MNKILQTGKRGQGLFSVLLLEAMFVVVWALFLGDWLSFVGQNYIEVTAATGLEAFFYANLNLWVFLILLMANVVLFKYGGSE